MELSNQNTFRIKAYSSLLTAILGIKVHFSAERKNVFDGKCT